MFHVKHCPALPCKSLHTQGEVSLITPIMLTFALLFAGVGGEVGECAEARRSAQRRASSSSHVHPRALACRGGRPSPTPTTRAAGRVFTHDFFLPESVQMRGASQRCAEVVKSARILVQ